MSLGQARRVLLLAVLVTAACRGGKDVGRRVSYTPPPDVDPATLPLPKNGSASILLRGSDIEIDWAPPQPGPMTAVSRCTRWIVGCVSGDRQLDDCARSAPACATGQPWNEAAACCPAACFQRYEKARGGGTQDLDAFAAVYFDTHDSCFPGLTALVGG